MKWKIICGIICLVGMPELFAQQPDSILLRGREIISKQLEHLEEKSEAGIDLSELTADLDYFLENPLNLNEADKSELKKLVFLTGIQIKNLVDYRKKYGTFYSIYELKAIDGLGQNTLEKIMPFVVVRPVIKTSFNHQRLLRGKHELILRYQRKLGTPAGYSIPADSLQAEKSGSFYLGDPNRYYLRYRYKVYNKLSIGLLAEKDPGELFFNMPSYLAASIKEQMDRPTGFDFYSFHLGFEDLGWIRKIVLGDYHVRFGQGLVLWSGLSFSGGSDPSTLKRYAPGISPNTSVNEGLFMRGGALGMAWKKLELSLFYSRRKTDANIVNRNSIEEASSLPSGGYHRTLNELQDKNAMLQQHYGGHITYSHEHFRLGMTAFRTVFDIDLVRDEKPSNIFRFRGRENLNAGIDFDILLKRTNLFGELACSINGGWAILAGLTHNTDNGSIMTILYREYRREYQNFMAQAYGKRDGNANERGIRIAMEVPLFRTFVVQISADHYTYPWLTSRNINTFRGQDHYVLLSYRPARNTELNLRYRYKNGDIKNKDNLSWIDELSNEKKHNFRFMLRYAVSSYFSFKSQAEYTLINSGNPVDRSRGGMILQDVYCHPPDIPLKIIFRYALFNTDGYGSRIYAYENDVLYASSMPAYYGKGFRYYVLIRYSPRKWLDTWLRFSMTNYTDRKTVGSGLEEMEGNKVPEVKVQLRIRL
ncbi:MAG: helix-hairpin-helix domain-containing protein [Bacteroidetes bacterium]|nr:helix-hairpin-helix domain-containing protein [Bacteroidota bacterium]